MSRPTQDQFDAIVNAFEDAGYETRHYSGRSMYGQECLGIVCPNPLQALMTVLSHFADRAEEADDVCQFIDQLGEPQADSMGLDSILYFPSCTLPKAQ